MRPTKSAAIAAIALTMTGMIAGCSSSSTPTQTSSPSAVAPSQGSQHEESAEPSAESSAEGDQG